jgi:hypothetical protein
MPAANPPEGMSRITPYLLYENVAGAQDLAARPGLCECLRPPCLHQQHSRGSSYPAARGVGTPLDHDDVCESNVSSR